MVRLFDLKTAKALIPGLAKTRHDVVAAKITVAGPRRWKLA